MLRGTNHATRIRTLGSFTLSRRVIFSIDRKGVDEAVTDGRTEWLLLVLLSAIWGGSFFFNEVILRELQPFTLVWGRTGFAAITLIIIVYASGHRLPMNLGTWGAFAVMGFLNNFVPFSLIVWGQQHIDSGLASILNATTPLFSVVLAHFLTSDERMTPGRVLGILLGIGGIVVLMGVDALREFGVQSAAQIAILGASCSYALSAIYGRRFQKLSPLVTAAGMLICSALLITPVALFVDQPLGLRPQFVTWSALLGLAVLCTAVAYLLYFRILAAAGATNLVLVTFLVPVSAILLGVLVLGERLTLSTLVGMALIFGGLIAVDGRVFGRV